MKLTGYRFGRVEANGLVYEHDLIVTPTEVREWRRREGHRVHPEDLAPALAAQPQVIVIGTGFSGLLHPTPEAEQALTDRRVELVVERTGLAVEAYHELAPSRRACALLHLTC